MGQFVRLLAALVQQKGQKLPFKNQEAWHLLFYELKKNKAGPGRPKFLDTLRFDWDGASPKCQQLSEFLNALHFTASVSGHNPGFAVIEIAPEIADQWTKSLDPNDSDAKKYVNDAVALAEREFATVAVA